jgi:3-isopropylmalate/(R)-2-methylmalate dehydratase small subunit
MSGRPFKTLIAIAAPLLRDNINTDVIIPSREIKHVSRRGLADGLFADWRYTAVGGRDSDPAFVLNDPRYAGCAILVTGANFGCGSSREHAAWALAEYGFRVILAESFNPIFRGNAVLNGIVPVVLPRPELEKTAALVSQNPAAHRVTVDLPAMLVVAPDGISTPFDLDAESRDMLLNGLDTIDLTLKRRSEIDTFRAADLARRPWAYPPGSSDF